MTPENDSAAPPEEKPAPTSEPAASMKAPGAEADVDAFRRQVDDLISKTDLLEKNVNEVVGFYDTKKHGSGGRRAGSTSRAVANGGREGACSKGMQDLMRQFGTIVRQITSHEWAEPFLKPVDVVGLQLDDYYKIITKPMDFSTIQNKMEGRDGTKYNNVREIYSDVRLIFSNAMKYNNERNDVHIMAKSLLEKFEEKWLQLLPKVENEEKRQKEEEVKETASMSNAREAAIAKLAKDTDSELGLINMQLEELRKMVIQRCRKMSTDEKRKLGAGLCHLSPEDLNKALEIVAQDNPCFQTTAEEVDLDMDAQSETTLWRLKFFVKEALERQANGAAAGKTDENAKRKREICNALAKTASKRIKKQP